MSFDVSVQAAQNMPAVNTPKVDAVRKQDEIAQRKVVEVGKELPLIGQKDGSQAANDAQIGKSTAASSKEVQAALRDLSARVQDIRRELNFSVDEETGRTMVTVMNYETKEIIRQIPSEELLEMVKQIESQLGDKGNLLNTQV